MKKYKSIKTFINKNNPFFMELHKEPKYELYIQKIYLFGLIKLWIYRTTFSYCDPKLYFNVVESNY